MKVFENFYAINLPGKINNMQILPAATKSCNRPLRNAQSDIEDQSQHTRNPQVGEGASSRGANPADY